MAPATQTKRQQLEIICTQLSQDQASFRPTWQDLADYIMPRRPRMNVEDINRGDRRSKNIIDGTATQAAEVLRAGMMSGITSPARPWFRLTTPDRTLAEQSAVKDWLMYVESDMRDIFDRSNTYQVLPIGYGDMGTFATGAIMIEEDFEEVIRLYSFPIGSYMIGVDERGRVNLFARDMQMTVRQLVSKFGREGRNGMADWSNFSGHVKNLFDNGNLDAWVKIRHVIRPNPDHDPKKLHSKFKRFESCYYEQGQSQRAHGYMGNEQNTYLRESGYDYFPVLAPRWEVTGEDSYGTNCPGLRALGDTRQLQLGERRIMQAIDKLVNPPMVGPPEMQNRPSSIMPSSMTYVAERDGMKGFRPAHEVRPEVDKLEGKQEQCRQRIRRAFYEDIFLMLISSDRRDFTAREIDARDTEKLTILGPMLGQTNQDLLNPMIDITFDIMVRQGRIPPPPDELSGENLRVEHISILAQAQKLVGVNNLERFMRFSIELAKQSGDPKAMYKIDLHESMDVYADMTGVPPGVVRPDDKVAEMLAADAAAQQKAQETEELALAAKGARDLAGAKLDEDNALARLLQSRSAA